MKTEATEHRVNRADAERVLSDHLASIGARHGTTHQRHRATVEFFLACSREEEDPSGQRLLLGTDQTQRVLIRVCAGKGEPYARQQLEILRRFSRALVGAGLIELDVVGQFQERHGGSCWGRLTQALQADNPEEALLGLLTVPPLPGPLTAVIEDYLELLQALGRKGHSHRYLLCDLDRFLRTQGVPNPLAVTPDLIERWAGTRSQAAGLRCSSLHAVRRFFEYLRSLRQVESNPVSASLLARARRSATPFKPFIFTTEQIAALLREAGNLRDTNKFICRALTCSTMLALLCALGLRHGEVCRLRLRDIDLSRNTLFIEQTKFHKSRHIPFGPRVADRLRRFFEIRRTALAPAQEGDPLFVTLSRGRKSLGTFQSAFRQLLARLEIADDEGRHAPRPHDLRHTFAVHRLLRWYREGVDVQSRLPLLSTFLGHADIHATQVYLSVTADLLKEANDRFYQQFGSHFDEEA